MGNAGIAVADPTYGMINPASVVAWALDGGNVSLDRLSLDGYHGFDRQTEAFGARLGEMRCGSTSLAIGISHARHRAILWNLPPNDPGLNPLIQEEARHDDVAIAVALRNVIEVGLGFRVSYRSYWYTDYSSTDRNYTLDYYYSGVLARARASDLIGYLTGDHNALEFGVFSLDGEIAYARVAEDNDGTSGHAFALLSKGWSLPFLSARWARDDQDHSHSSGWELGALGIASFRGGRHGLPSYSTPDHYWTHGWSVHTGGVFDWISKKKEESGTLHWVLTHLDASYQRSWNFRSEWSSWSFSLGTAQPF